MSDLAALVEQIDADPDRLHSDSTPAADALIRIGEPALPAVVPLLLSDRRETRLRALRVIELVTMQAYGFEIGRGWREERHERRWRGFWGAMSEGEDPRHLLSDEANIELAARWMRWLNDRPAS